MSQPENKEIKDDDLGLSDLQPATFSFGNPQFRAVQFPSFAATSFSSFQQDEEVWRSIPQNALSNNSSLTDETYRALDTGYSGEDVIDGGNVIGTDFPAFPAFKPTPQPTKASSISVKSLTTALPRVEPPSPPGDYLEPAYHVFSAANPTALMASVLTFLHQLQVDVKPKHDQFKIKCCAYRACARLSFYVHVFSMSPVNASTTEKRYAVEFQRRSGDALFFSEIYRQAKRNLSEQHLILIEKSKGSTVQEKQVPQLDAPVTVDQVRQTTKNLLQMVASKCADIKAQAIVALADLTASDPKVKDMMIQEGVLDAMIEELSSPAADVHRCAVTAVANLAFERDQVCGLLQEKGAVKILLQLAHSETAQVVRECARILANVGQTLGKKICDTEFKSTLKHIRGCPDSRAREHISQLLEQLGV